MPRAVILQHEQPDGAHLDLLLARYRESNSPLVSFRLDQRPDLAPHGALLRATRLPDHRDHYLDFEGEIPGDKGRVSRLARGVCRIVADSGRSFAALTRWEHGGARRLVGFLAPEDGVHAWRIRVIARTPPAVETHASPDAHRVR